MPRKLPVWIASQRRAERESRRKAASRQGAVLAALVRERREAAVSTCAARHPKGYVCGRPSGHVYPCFPDLAAP